MSKLYIGLMSGTSVDGIDAALVDFSTTKPVIVGTHYTAYSDEIRRDILALCQEGNDEIQRMGTMDQLLGRQFAEAVKELLLHQKLKASDIEAIGSHGQTIRHYPYQQLPFTLQIGDPNTIAALTGITTIADFRRRDIALGGQGAPLVPAFHQAIFADEKINRVIVNIGGIANITLLPKKTKEVLGFDTGPGNILLDAWIAKKFGRSRDDNGAWGQSGRVNKALLEKLLSDDYFKLPPPKSSGREYFNLDWLAQFLQTLPDEYLAEDVQATLTALTAQSIVTSIQQYMQNGEIIVCGGGTHNQFLMDCIKEFSTPNFKVLTTSEFNIHPDWVEAVAFAWLAYRTMNRQHGNLPSVTGAKSSSILGGVYFA